MGEYIILIRTFSRVSMMEVLNKGMYSSLVEVNKLWRKRKRLMRVFKGFSIIVTYVQVENTLVIHLRYLHIL